jgi:hypothetical protein
VYKLGCSNNLEDDIRNVNVRGKEESIEGYSCMKEKLSQINLLELFTGIFGTIDVKEDGINLSAQRCHILISQTL